MQDDDWSTVATGPHVPMGQSASPPLLEVRANGQKVSQVLQ